MTSWQILLLRFMPDCQYGGWALTDLNTLRLALGAESYYTIAVAGYRIFNKVSM